MLSLDDLIKFAEIKNIPHEKRRGTAREYLQTLILYYLQQTKYAKNLIFIGGTALRFFYNTQRFSEDLDFNYLGKLQKADLEKIMDFLKKEFTNENIEIENSIKKSNENNFHFKIYIQFKNVLQFYKCSGIKDNKLNQFENLSIQLDFQNLYSKKYPLEKKIISNFGKRFIFNSTSLDMFLAEKSKAMLFRSPPRARDFFDFISLIDLGAQIDLKLMRQREISVKSKEEYKGKIIKRCNQIDFQKLTDQLAPFLFKKEDVEIMKNFNRYLTVFLNKI